MEGTFLLDFQTEINQIEFIHEKVARFLGLKESLALSSPRFFPTDDGVNIFIVEGFNKKQREGSGRCDL